MGKKFANEATDKELISKIQKQFMQHNIKQNKKQKTKKKPKQKQPNQQNGWMI